MPQLACASVDVIEVYNFWELPPTLQQYISYRMSCVCMCGIARSRSTELSSIHYRFNYSNTVLYFYGIASV